MGTLFMNGHVNLAELQLADDAQSLVQRISPETER
jgi:hypothetical protein